jgi:CheY-like chemotaxis protein
MQDRTILVADDDENEVLLLRPAFAKTDSLAALQFVTDGEEAMAYLKGEHPYSNRKLFPFPDLLLLDLKMPRMNGIEVLEAVRGHSLLKRLPVVVLTVSDRPKDIALALEAGANSVLTKPRSAKDLASLARAVQDYWLNWNQTTFVQTPPLPRRRR